VTGAESTLTEAADRLAIRELFEDTHFLVAFVASLI
jgi:hypothetical protein